MAQGARPQRVAEEIRQEISQLLAREVHDPRVGFVTVTRVTVSPDLQLARIYYTQMGDEKARRETVRALERVTPFLRREIGRRMRLRRVPELAFHFDEGVEHQARIERILLDLEAERRDREPPGGAGSSRPDEAPPGGAGFSRPNEEPPGGAGFSRPDDDDPDSGGS